MAAEQGFDASLKLRMASIIYVHTQRFYSELLAFFNHFHQHQNVMNRIREAAMGTTVNETASRGMKLRLDIEAESPLLLLPVSSSSPRLLVVHLGFLRVSVTSVVKFEGAEVTHCKHLPRISCDYLFSCFLDITLADFGMSLQD